MSSCGPSVELRELCDLEVSFLQADTLHLGLGLKIFPQRAPLGFVLFSVSACLSEASWALTNHQLKYSRAGRMIRSGCAARFDRALGSGAVDVLDRLFQCEPPGGSPHHSRRPHACLGWYLSWSTALPRNSMTAHHEESDSEGDPQNEISIAH